MTICGYCNDFIKCNNFEVLNNLMSKKDQAGELEKRNYKRRNAKISNIYTFSDLWSIISNSLIPVLSNNIKCKFKDGEKLKLRILKHGKILTEW